MVEEQSGKIEAQSKAIEQLGKQIEYLSKQLDAGTVAKKRLQQPDPAGRIPAAATVVPPEVRPAQPAMAGVAAEAPTAPAAEAPAASGDTALSHVVKKGENLTTIARRANTTVVDILKLNKIEDERKLQIGQVLILPKPATSGSSQPNKESH